MRAQIDTLAKRKKLAPRREPYWHKLGKGCFLGFRKTKDTHGTWVGRTQKGQNKKYTSLGSDNELTFEGASSNALRWFKAAPFDNQPEKIDYTIRMAVNDYIAHLKIHNSEDAAYRAQKQLYKHLIPKLGDIKLQSLKTVEFKKWRESLITTRSDSKKAITKSTSNRILSSAKASFNIALENEHIHSDSGWKKVTAFVGADKCRDLFLSKKQVALLLNKSQGDFHLLVKAHLLTGTRPGELSNTTVKDFDKNNGTLFIDGKTGTRNTYLQDSAFDLISELVKKKKKTQLIFEDNNAKWTKKSWGDQLKDIVKANSLSNNTDDTLSPSEIENQSLPTDTIMYSLRHYHISQAILAGLPLLLIAENCGTSVKIIEKNYGKFIPNDRIKMFNKVSFISNTLA